MNHSLFPEKAKCLVLYDWQEEISIASWLAMASEFFERNEAVVKYCEIITKNNSKKVKYDIETISNIQDITAISLYDNLKITSGDWRTFAGFNFSGRRKKTNALICSEKKYTEKSIDFSQLVAIFPATPCYGHSYVRLYNRGPEMFAYDIIYGDVNRAEANQMDIWYGERLDVPAQDIFAKFRHKFGMIRDVYEFNVLNINHLNHLIKNVPFFKWIDQHKYRGYINLIKNNLYCWAVSNEMIPIVREELYLEGMIIR